MNALVAHAAGSARQSIRQSDDPFTLGLDTKPGSRASEDSLRLARELSTVVGPKVPVIDRYLAVLCNAPAHHLECLRRRGTRIVFAPTIAHGLTSRLASARRGRELSASETFELRTYCSQRSGTAAVFDHPTDLLVLPTSYAPQDLEHVVLHELGHALTMLGAIPRPALLLGLPPQIERHLAAGRYGSDPSPASIRRRVWEVLAEAYAHWVVGNGHLIPHDLLSELMFIIETVSEEHQQVRFDFGALFHD